MRLTWMIPTVLVVTSSSLVALAEGPMVPGASRGAPERPRAERFRPERSSADRNAERHVVLRAERIRARGEMIDGVSASRLAPAARGVAPASGTRAAPLAGAISHLRARGEVEGAQRSHVQATGQRGSDGEQGRAGSFRVSPRLSGGADSRVRCAEGDPSCGSNAREAPIAPAPSATGRQGSSLLQATKTVADVRDKVAQASEAMKGKMSRTAFFCAVAASEACTK